MRFNNEIKCVMKHVGNPSVGALEIEGTVESVLKQIFASMSKETLFTRIDISISRDLTECHKALSGRRGKSTEIGEDDDWFKELERQSMEIAESTGDQ